MTEETALEMARKVALAEMRAEDAEAEVERLRDVLAQVRAVFDLQCPPMSPGKYVDHGAWVAHSWWNKVLGNVLKQAELIDALQSFPSGESDAPVCPWCKASGTDPCRSSDGLRRVHHKARARMERAAHRQVNPPD